MKGKEDHGTHFDISVQEKMYHRLMNPGKVFSVDLLENEISYFKFSYPSQEPKTCLHFQIEYEYGDFEVFVSRSNEFPSKESNDYTY